MTEYSRALAVLPLNKSCTLGRPAARVSHKTSKYWIIIPFRLHQAEWQNLLPESSEHNVRVGCDCLSSRNKRHAAPEADQRQQTVTAYAARFYPWMMTERCEVLDDVILGPGAGLHLAHEEPFLL